MSCTNQSGNINQTFIIEPVSSESILSGCSGVFSNYLFSCSGNTNISLDTDVINFNGNIFTNNNISGGTFYGDGSNLSGITTIDTYVTGGSLNVTANTITFTNNTGGTFPVSGVISQDIFTNNTGGIVHGLTDTLVRNGDISLSGLTRQFSTTPTTPSILGGGSSFGHIDTGGGTYTGFIQLFGNSANGQMPNVLIGSTLSAATTSPAMTFCSVRDNTYNKYTGATQTLFRFINGYLPGRDLIVDIKTNDIVFYSYPTNRIDTGTTSNFLATDTSGRLISKPLSSITTSSIFTGGTVSGATNFTNGLTANTISATTYLGLPIDVYVTGGTYSVGTGNITLINNTGGTFNISGITTSSGVFTGGTVTGPTEFIAGLTANTISATTYFGLPTDVYVTGGTFSAGTAEFTNNTGGTFSVSGFGTGTGSSFTGGTVSGGTTFTNGLTANTFTGNKVEIITVGENVVSGNLLYLSTDSMYYKVDNHQESKSSTELRIATETILLGNNGIGLINGIYTTTGLNSGGKYWLGDNGDFVSALPIDSGSIIRKVGVAFSSTEFIFNPDNSYFEIN